MNNRTAMNTKSNAILKDKFERLGITWCEYLGCSSNYMLHFCHRKKRRHYGSVEELSDINQVLLLCAVHDNLTEYDRPALEELFIKLRQ